MADISPELEAFNRSLSGLTGQSDDLMRARSLELQKSLKVAAQLDNAAEGIASAGKTFVTAMVSPTPGLSKFADSLATASTSIGTFAKLIPYIGGLADASLKLFAYMGSEGLRRQETLAKSFENLSEISSIATGGLEGLLGTLHSIGLTSAEAEKLVTVLRPVTKDMSSFGGSVTEGSKKLTELFSQFVGPGNTFEQQLLNIGYTTDTIRDSVASYVSLQTKLGLSQTKSTGELVTGAKNYLLTLKELQELTGSTRDELQKQREAQLSDARFRLTLRGMEEKTATKTQNQMSAIATKFGPEFTEGMMDLFVNNGAITTEAAAKVMMTAPDAYKLFMEGLQSEGKPEDVAKLLKGTADNVMSFAGTFIETIKLSNEALRDMGAYNKLLNGAIEVQRADFGKLSETIREINKLEKEGTPMMNDRVKIEQEQRQLRIATDKALIEAGNGFVWILQKTTHLMYEFGSETAAAIDKVTSVFAKHGFGKATDVQSYFTRAAERPSTSGGPIGEPPARPPTSPRTGSRYFGSTSSMYDPYGNNITEDLARQRTAAAEALKERGTGRVSDIWSKIKGSFKGAESYSGGHAGSEADPALVALAEKIMELYPNFSMTAMDDSLHRNKYPNSPHVRGKAIDFTVPGFEKKSPEETRAIKEQLKNLGAKDVRDEYNDDFIPGVTTGKHFHVEVAKFGGLFNGPSAGYPVMLHGNESVWPENKLAGLLKDVQKTSIDQYKEDIVTEMRNSASSISSSSGSDNSALISLMANKLDDMISILERSYSTQDELLTYTKA